MDNPRGGIPEPPPTTAIPGYEILDRPEENFASYLVFQRNRVGEDIFKDVVTRIEIVNGFATAFLKNGNALSYEWGYNKTYPQTDAHMGIS